MSSVYIPNAEPNILLFGDIMLDRTYYGSCNKIANEAPIPVVNVTCDKYSIGGCGNVLYNLFALGAKNVFLFSRIGDDKNGEKIIELLPKNTHNNLITDTSFTTITKNRFYCDNKLVFRYDNERIYDINEEYENKIISNFNEILLKHKISSIIFSDYNKGFLTKSLCQKVISLATIYNIPTIVDPKVDYTKYIGCTIIKPNKTETKNIFGIDLNTVSYEEGHIKLQSLVKSKVSVITLAGNGISVYSDNQHVHVSEDIKEVIDVTGAGDIVCSVFGMYYPFIDNIQLVTQIANHLASISVSHLGVYTITNNDLISTYKYIHKTKVINLHLLPKLEHKKVVFTNGCFDILHSAHIELFKYCKSIGDIVIIGLNSDTSIKRLKGASRPINNLEERIKMLDAIDYIDYIIPFEEDTPIELIKQITPDYLVKGGDYTKDTIVGKEYANDTLIFNYINGKSTTNIINYISQHTN